VQQGDTQLKTLLPILLLALLAAGCVSPPEGPAGPDEPDGPDQPDDPGDQGNCLPEAEGVVFVDELAAGDECPFGEGPCIDDYLAFPELAAEWTDPLTDLEFEDYIHEMRAGIMPLFEGPLSSDELRIAVLAGARIDFLVDGIESRELRVSDGDQDYLAETDQPSVIRNFQLEDPWVGRFWGIVAHPEGPGPFPTVIGIHGHTEDATEWMISRGGVDLVNRGYAVIYPTMRVNDGDLDEALVTETLMRADLSFVGLRIYEQLLTLRYAAALGVVDRCRIGMMGHSGGAVSGNATIRVADGISAWVTDLTSSYYIEGPVGGWIDETSPGLFALQLLINDFTTATMPVLEVGYNFEIYDADPPISQWPEVADFLDEHLLAP